MTTDYPPLHRIGRGVVRTDQGYVHADGSPAEVAGEGQSAPSIIELTAPPRCPRCEQSLGLTLKFTAVAGVEVGRGRQKATRLLHAAYCAHCGHTLNTFLD